MALGVLESIFRGGMQLRADVSGAPAPWDDFWYNPAGGDKSSAGMRVSPESSKRLSTVIACVSAKSRQLAMLPCKIYTDVSGGGKRPVTNHPLYDVLYYQPNNVQTAFEFKQMMQSHVELRGNAFARKVPGPRGPVDQLIPMHPDRVKVEVLKDSGRLRYVYNNPLTGNTDVLVQDEVFHLREFPDSMAVGQSRITMALDTLGVALARQDYIARFLKNDTQTGSAIVGTNFKTKEDEDKFRANWQKATTGANRGKVVLLPPGLDLKSMGVKPVDAQLLEGQKASDLQICTIFNVLPHVIGVDAGKSATYASVEQFNIMNQQQSVLPMVVMWEQAIQRDLIVSERYYAKISMASILRGDSATRAIFYNSAIASGWMNQDDVREEEDMNPIPNGEGQTYWRPMNWAPLSQLTAPQPASGSGNNDSEGDGDATDDQTAGEGSGGDRAATERLKVMATAQAERCVRREVSGAKKLIERNAGNYEITEFYADQWRFIVEVFHMDIAGSLQVKRGCDLRAQQLAAFLFDEQMAEALAWLESVAVTEPGKLSALAVEGVK